MVTPELLATAEHVVWYDSAQITGTGTGVSAAPEVFGWDPAGNECFRFGKILGLRRGPAASMPLLPDVYSSAVEAQESEAGVINIRALLRGEIAIMVWQRFLSDQINAIGNLAVNCLLDGQGLNESVADRYQYARGLHYVASVLDPEIPLPGLAATCYDDFDALSYVGVAGAKDVTQRRQTAAGLQEAAQRIKSGNSKSTDNNMLTLSVYRLFDTSARATR